MEPLEADTFATASRHCREHLRYALDFLWTQPFTGIEVMPEMFFCYYSNEYCPVISVTTHSRTCGRYYNPWKVYTQMLDQKGYALCLHPKEDGTSGVCGQLIDPEYTSFDDLDWTRVQNKRANTMRKCSQCQHEQTVKIEDGWQWRCEKCEKTSCIVHGSSLDEHTSCVDYEIELNKKKVRGEFDEQLKKTEPSRLAPCPQCRSLIVPTDRNKHVYLHCLFCGTSFCSSCNEQVEGPEATKAHYGVRVLG